MKPLSVVTYFKTTTSDLRRQQTVHSFGLDQLPCCERHEMNAPTNPNSELDPPHHMPERFATRNDIPQVEPVPALDSLHWPKMPKKLMQAAVVHILLLHSCTVVCNLHCLYYSHFCVNLFVVCNLVVY